MIRTAEPKTCNGVQGMMLFAETSVTVPNLVGVAMAILLLAVVLSVHLFSIALHLKGIKKTLASMDETLKKLSTRDTPSV
jgi:hypothetical protein